jgi:hypothetical protein
MALVVVDALLLAVFAWTRLFYRSSSNWWVSWCVLAALLLTHPCLGIWRFRFQTAVRRSALVEALADVMKSKLKEIAGKDYPVEYLEGDLLDDFKSKKWPASYRLVETGEGEQTEILKISKQEFRSLLPLALASILADTRSRVTQNIVEMARFGGVKLCVKYTDGMMRAGTPLSSASGVSSSATKPPPSGQVSGGHLAFGR